MKIGIDTGRSSIKGISEIGEPLLIPAVHYEIDKNDLPQERMKNTGSSIVSIDNLPPMIVGEEALAYRSSGIKAFTSDTFQKYNRLYTLYTLSKLVNGSDEKIQLGINLTTSDIKFWGNQLRAELINERIIRYYNQEGREIKNITLNIEKVMIFIQGFTAIYNYCTNANNDIDTSKAKLSIACIDIGEYSLDLIITNSLRIIYRFSVPLGMSHVYTEIQKRISEKYGEVLELHLIQNKMGFEISTGKHTIKPHEFLEDAVKKVAENIVNQIDIYLDRYTKDVILLTGGPASLFLPYIKKLYPRTEMTNTPQFDNAMGCYKLMLGIK